MRADFSKYLLFAMLSKSISASCIWFCQKLARPSRTIIGNAYAIAVFDKDMIVATDRDEEEHDLDIIKDVYPLFPFRSLSTHVEHAVCKAAGLEDRFTDAGRP